MLNSRLFLQGPWIGSAHHSILALLLALTLQANAGALNEQESRRSPNVLVIFTDDMGYADLGYFGTEDIHTPHIDRLAGRGVQFTQAYVSDSICGPSVLYRKLADVKT